MNADQLVEQLESSRERLLVALESLPEEALTEGGAFGTWSVADVLSHLTAWESELVTALMRIRKGKKPGKLLNALADVEGYNDRAFQASAGRDLEQIFEDLHGARRHLESWVDEFSPGELLDGKRFPWAKGRPLSQIIREISIDHEAEHAAEIESFRERWRARRPAESSGEMSESHG